MYQTKLSAGLDLRTPNLFFIAPLSRHIVDTGIYLKDILPPDLHYGRAEETDIVPCALVCSRSGLAAKQGVIVLNAPGIIDADYEDTIKVILYNTDSTKNVCIEQGERIAQLIFTHAYRQTGLVKYEDRQGGLGSTGV